MNNPSTHAKPVKRWQQQLQERSTRAKLMVASLLLLLLALVALPSYLSGNWPWAAPVAIENIDQIRALRKNPLTLPDWQFLLQAELLNGAAMPLDASNAPATELRPQNPTLAIAEVNEVRDVRIGGQRWSYQELANPEAGEPPIGVYLLPQMDHDKLPEVEWVDVRGAESWREEAVHSLKFTATAGDRQTKVNARFFRAAAERSYAVVQWYAWPNGGSRSTVAWFWRDQLAQLLRHRQPWVAVYLKIPMRAQSE
ncbi:MAG: cyanoexosortase B system-associated protein, partial [Spirulinaceae cyanobacterium RM2_2_10]|nr:cyanoexosortase B system-associated protein [Spirulinaceae cyanobacterium RM2_2_10]